jgi:hypothetical protein
LLPDICRIYFFNPEKTGKRGKRITEPGAWSGKRREKSGARTANPRSLRSSGEAQVTEKNFSQRRKDAMKKL